MSSKGRGLLWKIVLVASAAVIVWFIQSVVASPNLAECHVTRFPFSLLELAGWVLAFLAMRAVITVIGMAKGMEKLQAIDLSGKLVAILCHSATGPLAIWYLQWANARTGVHWLYCDEAPLLHSILCLWIGYNVTDLLGSPLWSEKPSDRILIQLHHLGICLIFPVAYSWGVSHQYILWCMSTEVTGVPLTIWRLSQQHKPLPLFRNLFAALFLFYRLPCTIFICALQFSMQPWDAMAYLGLPQHVQLLSYAMWVPMMLNLFWSLSIIEIALRQNKKPKAS